MGQAVRKNSTDDRAQLLEVLEAHWVMTLATNGEHGPYTAQAFYAVTDNGENLVFTSSCESNHSRHLEADKRASASIYLETKQLGRIQGVQMCGTVEVLSGEEEKRLGELYFKVHPEARAIKALKKETHFYAFRTQWAKLIDNRFGLGKPIEWDFIG